MTTSPEKIEELVSQVPLGAQHRDQERVVAAALRRLLIDKQRGMVLADEVGFGKTYEALAIVAHLCASARQRRKSFDHALVLCKPALVQKWEEETRSTRTDRGFPRYLPGKHPAQSLFADVRCIDKRATAHKLRREGVKGQRVAGRHRVPPGFYIVNERLLQEEKRSASTLLRQIWRTRWDVVIIDEAHHYARGNKPVRLFAPDGDLENYQQQGLDFDKILALTATPFSLSPHELVKLLALIRADRTHLELTEAGLKNFVQELDRFFELRERSPGDSLRQQQVTMLERLRDEDALNQGATGQGLQTLLGQYIVRNTKQQNERRYFLIERGKTGFQCREFRKLDENLPQCVKLSPLIPFEGEHTLFYLELRELIQDITERARDGEATRTFIPTELRQGLSSYPQIASSELLNRDLPGAQRLRGLVDQWHEAGKLHPKVTALAEMVREIVETEIAKVRQNPGSWFSKVLIFNKLIRGTAPQLIGVLRDVLHAPFNSYLDELLTKAHISRDKLKRKARQAVNRQIDDAERDLAARPEYAPWCHVPDEFTHDDFIPHRGQSLLRVFHKPLQRRAVQSLALIDLLRDLPTHDDLAIERWITRELTEPIISTVKRVIDRYLDDTPHEDEPWDTLVDRAQRELVALLEETKSIDLVGRFDGDNVRDRESHRRNFNQKYSPFALLVSQVGEEGIDLQEQCRYVIHYDLEWNPARMEQREGRVDRRGWGRASEGFIDVRFLLLKGTYEERIFHTVMQRDQWFQVLIGSKKREMGKLPDDIEDEIEQDRIEDRNTTGGLTEEEKARVMLDLRPDRAGVAAAGQP